MQGGAYAAGGAMATDPNASQDRGLMGALAGGAMGGFAGHKVNHGFLGAVGGAITGSVAEDALKKKSKDKKGARRIRTSMAAEGMGRNMVGVRRGAGLRRRVVVAAVVVILIGGRRRVIGIEMRERLSAVSCRVVRGMAHGHGEFEVVV